MIVLRFRTKEGMLRIEADPDGDFLLVLEQLATKIHTLLLQLLTLASSPSDQGHPANSMCGQTPNQMGLTNGHLFYAKYDPIDSEPSAPLTVAINAAGATVEIKDALSLPLKPKEFDVDIELSKEDGQIKRQRSSMCRHGDKGMCEYCLPLPPWDKDYRESHNIKHMLFHAHLRELNENTNNRNQSLSYIAPLTEPNYKIDLTCTNGHQPYPKGICSKCQPLPITLSQQKFRMVDHVEFASFDVLNQFIDAWRRTGIQRFGVMYGHYEKAPDVPLGIKAVVEAIYEPPQAGEADGITLLEWENEKQVDELAAELGLYQVGMTFTDLTDSGSGNGLVLCKRHKDLYFLSNLEILMAGRNQIRHPNPSQWLALGQYSSKFVTTVILGGLQGEIEPKSYMVLALAEALIKADMILGSTQPSEIMVNETTLRRYVPDISFSKINKYGLEVKTNAKPTFPVEFLLVSLTDSFPVEPQPMFSTNFPIENRESFGVLQDLGAARQYLNGGDGSRLADFHFLAYLAKTGILGANEWRALIKYIKNKDDRDYLELVESPGWMTFMTILEQSS